MFVYVGGKLWKIKLIMQGRYGRMERGDEEKISLNLVYPKSASAVPSQVKSAKQTAKTQNTARQSAIHDVRILYDWHEEW
jgi:hypothetical protein